MNGHDFTREQNMEARMTLAITAHTLDRLPHGRFFVDLTMFADRPKILERFAVRYGKYLKGNRTALDVTIIDPTGLVARHIATIKPEWD